MELRLRDGLTRADLVARVNIEGFTNRALARVEQGTRLVKEDELNQIARILLGSVALVDVLTSEAPDFDAAAALTAAPEPPVAAEQAPPDPSDPRKGCTRCNDQAVMPYRLCPRCSEALDAAYRKEMLDADNSYAVN